MQLRTLHELFVLEIKDLYSAENQLIKALPKMAKKARTTALKEGFLKHLEQTKEHMNRLDEISDNLEFNPKGHVCQAMKGLIEEVTEFIECKGDADVMDAGLIAVAQKIEHYEIAGYGTVIEFAKLMKHTSEVALLEKTLEEETKTDLDLSKIAITEVNINASESNKELDSDE